MLKRGRRSLTHEITIFSTRRGSVSSTLAVTPGADIQAYAPFYGAAANSENVPRFRTALLIQCAEQCQRINAVRDEYKAALTAAGINFEMHTDPGTRLGFHNHSTPRHSEDPARLAWQRAIAFFKEHLS